MSEYIYERPDEPAKVVRDGWNVRVEWDFKQREEIVRCRDCKYLCDDGSTWGCGWHCSCLTTNDGTPPDGFCAWGEKK